MHRGFFLPVKAFPPAPNGPGTGGGRCHATYLCGERFNSRPPWGGRQFDVDDESYKAIFQSTPSARRATQKSKSDINNYLLFQSTPSARRATRHPRCCFDLTHISIHALREEGDSVPGTTSAPAPDFNPRPPRGGRRTDCPARQQDNDISIHALREEGDTSCLPSPQKANISIHALREEGDALPEMSTSLGVDFNPRPPRGGRRDTTDEETFGYQISIHALREEGDTKRPDPNAPPGYFNPRPPRGGRPM